MAVITKEQLNEIREKIAKAQGLKCGQDVKCYRCKKWGYNCHKVLNSRGESVCLRDKTTGKTACSQWCKRFERIEP